ncbi:restriction endonuclease subunit S [Maricaulis virginensis]|uniref:Restriction modification system DNA specificity domain-containing protein n=1 Tax=Maricaulis virginensis TaxID=144022 RepID=A0A9W6IQ17_9PROT|nr:restriction endonuclease subunit S [Maricaulis virginensis]GLK53214.1 restriction modification system DNA specificity domain-containing protein [Maricaulis virginensis]
MTDIMTLHEAPNWQLYRLGQLFDERKEKVSDKDYPPLSVTMNGIVPQLETAAKSDDGDNRKLVKVGDYVINSRSDRKGSGGISSHDGSVSLISIVIKPKGVHPRFAHHLLRSTAFQEEFYRWGHGIVADLWTTRYPDMKNIRLYLPDLDTQKAIADFLDRETARIDQLIEKKQRFLTVLDQKWAATVTSTVTNGLGSDVRLKDSDLSSVGKVPEHWTVARLGHIGRCANGINIGGDAFGSGTPFVSYGDVYKNAELPTEVSGLVQATSEDRSRYSVKKGDVFFTRTSETVEEIGFSSVCTQDMEDAVFAGFLIRFRPFKKKLVPQFSKYLFRNQALRSFFSKEMMIVTRASLSQGLLQKLPVLLPPLKEQEEIASYLHHVEAKHLSISDKTQESINGLKEFRSALITAAVTGQIDVTSWGKQGQTDRRLDQIEEDMALREARACQ